MRESFHIYSANHYLTLQTHQHQTTNQSTAKEVPIQQRRMFTYEDKDIRGQSPFEAQAMKLPYNSNNARQWYAPGITPKV